jgi:hypothetical protein
MKHTIKADAAETVLGWINTRGGVLVWNSIDLSDPYKSWTTPATGPAGEPVTKPSWQAANEPAQHITSADDIEVVVPKEARRFRVALRMGASGIRVKLTDASSRKLRAALDKLGPASWHEFDYATQEAICYVPSTATVTLAAYARKEKTA